MEYELYVCPVVVGPFRDFNPQIYFILFIYFFKVFRCFDLKKNFFFEVFRCFVSLFRCSCFVV